MTDIKTYIIHNFTVAGDWLTEGFSPITDFNGDTLDLTGLSAEMSITTMYGGQVATLTTADSEIVLTSDSMKWKKNVSALAKGQYNYVLKIEDEDGNMIPRMKGKIKKETI